MDLFNSMALRIRLARRSARLTQCELAARLGLSRSAVAQWESADGSSPSASNLGRMAMELGCSYEWLATGRGSRVDSEGKAISKRFGGSSHAEPADPLEERLLSLYRLLGQKDQQILATLASLLFSRRTDRPVSGGPGEIFSAHAS